MIFSFYQNNKTQAKLGVALPNDHFKQNDGAMASQIMYMPEAPLPIQRKLKVSPILLHSFKPLNIKNNAIKTIPILLKKTKTSLLPPVPRTGRTTSL